MTVLNTWEAEAGGSGVQGQLEQLSESYLRKKKKIKKK